MKKCQNDFFFGGGGEPLLPDPANPKFGSGSEETDSYKNKAFKEKAYGTPNDNKR
jgi:hypothetical protein